MEITILATNKPGVLFKSTLVFNYHQYKIEQKHNKQVNSNQNLYTFVLSDDGNFEGLLEDLMVLPNVVEVKLQEPNLENNKAKAEISLTQLLRIAENLTDLYPDFVEAVRELDKNPEIDDLTMLQIGQYVGEGLIAHNKVKQVSPHKISLALKKIVLPAIEPFSIANVKKDTVELYANPFCSNHSQLSDEPRCYFLKGMIQGLLQSVEILSNTDIIEETACKASGANSCIFTITKSAIHTVKH